MFRSLATALAILSIASSVSGHESGGSYGSSDFGGESSGGGSTDFGGSSSGDYSSGGSSGSSEPSRPPSAATFEVPASDLGTAFITMPEAPRAEQAAMGGG